MIPRAWIKSLVFRFLLVFSLGCQPVANTIGPILGAGPSLTARVLVRTRDPGVERESICFVSSSFRVVHEMCMAQGCTWFFFESAFCPVHVSLKNWRVESAFRAVHLCWRLFFFRAPGIEAVVDQSNRVEAGLSGTKEKKKRCVVQKKRKGECVGPKNKKKGEWSQWGLNPRPMAY